MRKSFEDTGTVNPPMPTSHSVARDPAMPIVGASKMLSLLNEAPDMHQGSS